MVLPEALNDFLLLTRRFNTSGAAFRAFLATGMLYRVSYAFLPAVRTSRNTSAKLFVR